MKEPLHWHHRESETLPPNDTYLATTTHPDVPSYLVRRREVTGRAGEKWEAFAGDWYSGPHEGSTDAKAAAEEHWQHLASRSN